MRSSRRSSADRIIDAPGIRSRSRRGGGGTATRRDLLRIPGRLDPHFEAPNQIKASPIHRGAMVRIPLGNERSKRIEVRSIAPDANPYMAIYTCLRTGLDGPQPDPKDTEIKTRTRFLPDNIYDAIRLFKASRFVTELFGEEVQGRFAELKLASAERCPKALGSHIKTCEVQFHHEVTNQHLWGNF